MNTKQIDNIINELFKRIYTKQIDKLMETHGDVLVKAGGSPEVLYHSEMELNLRESKNLIYKLLFGLDRHKELKELKLKNKTSMIKEMSEEELHTLTKVYDACVKYMNVYKELPNFSVHQDCMSRTLPLTFKNLGLCLLLEKEEKSLLTKIQTIKWFYDLF